MAFAHHDAAFGNQGRCGKAKFISPQKRSDHHITPGFHLSVGLNRDSLYRLAFCYERMGEYRKAADALTRLDNEFPEGREGKDRKKLWTLINAGLEKPE